RRALRLRNHRGRRRRRAHHRLHNDRGIPPARYLRRITPRDCRLAPHLLEDGPQTHPVPVRGRIAAPPIQDGGTPSPNPPPDRHPAPHRHPRRRPGRDLAHHPETNGFDPVIPTIRLLRIVAAGKCIFTLSYEYPAPLDITGPSLLNPLTIRAQPESTTGVSVM